MFYLKHKNILNTIQKIQILVADLLTPLCVKCRINANTITVTRLIVAILVTFIFFGNSYYLNLVGLFLMAIIISFDILDGKVARETHTTSELGRFLDESSDQIIMYCVFLNLFLFNKSSILNLDLTYIGIIFLIGHAISLNVFRELDNLLSIGLSSSDVLYEDVWNIIENKFGPLNVLDILLISHIDVHRYSITRLLYTASYLILIGIVLNCIALTFLIISIFTYIRLIFLLFIILCIKRNLKINSYLITNYSTS